MKGRWSFLLLLTGLCAVAHCRPPQYHFIGTALPWLKAQTYCRARYADLATVFDIEDMNRLVNTAQDATGGFTKKAWIGLHDNLTSWRWSFSDRHYYRGKEGGYRNWDVGQPDNLLGEQLCVKMSRGGVWDDSKCFLRNHFICYDGTASRNKRFIFVRQVMSWPGARLYCRKRHTDLASIRNKEENQEIHLLAKNRSVWIGLFRTLEWSDRSDSTYRNWRNGQPDNVGGKQGCIATDLGNAGLWSDERCSRNLAFICYGENNETPDKPTTTTTTTISTTTSTTTTLTPNKITTTEGVTTSTKTASRETSNNELLSTTEIETTSGHLSTQMTSSEQPPAPHVDPTTPITDETPNKPVVSTFTTNQTTTIERDSISSSSAQFSTPELDQTTSIPVTLNKQTSTDIETTTGRVSTEFISSEQPSTQELHQMTSVPDEPPHKPVVSTTTSTQNKMTITEEDANSAPITSNETTNKPVSQETPDNSFSSSATVTTSRRTTTETGSTTDHVSAEITSSEQPLTSEVEQTRTVTNETPNQRALATTTTVTPNRITTERHLSSTKIISTEQLSTPELDKPTSYLSTQVTTPGHPSTLEAVQSTPISDETTNKLVLATVTKSKITTIKGDLITQSVTGHLRPDITSLKQPSRSEVDQTRPATDESSNQPDLSTTTTTVTTTETGSTTGHVGTETTSSEQPSTTYKDQTKLITIVSPNQPVSSTTTTVTQKKTTTERDLTSTETTSSEQPSTSEVEQIKTVTSETPHQIILSSATTTVTQNKITTTHRDSTTTVFTSSAQLSTPELHQATPLPDHTSCYSTTITLSPNRRNTPEVHLITGPLGPEVTSLEQPSTPHVDQTRPAAGETPNQTPLSSTTTTITPELDQTTSVPGERNTVPHVSLQSNQAALSTTEVTTTEGDSTSAEASSQHLTAKVDQTRSAEYVIKMGVTFTSRIQLSEDDIQQLVLVEFHKLLIEKGLPESIKVGLTRPVK